MDKEKYIDVILMLELLRAGAHSTVRGVRIEECLMGIFLHTIDQTEALLSECWSKEITIGHKEFSNKDEAKYFEVKQMLAMLKTQAREVLRGVPLIKDIVLVDIKLDSFYFVLDQTESLFREYMVKEDRRDDTRRFL